MHYVYLLQTDSNKDVYVGCTNNLQRRVEEHNSGKVTSTKEKRPLKLIHYEAFLNQTDAYDREKFLKTGWGRKFIKKNLKNYFYE